MWQKFTEFFKLSDLAVSYVLLTIVMGGRTALWVGKFDQLIPIGGSQVSAFSALMALALVVGVIAVARALGRAAKGSRTWWLALAGLLVLAGGDGLFNIAEAHYIAATTGTFDEITDPALRRFFDFTITFVGVLPTLGTIILAMLAGAKQYDAEQETATDDDKRAAPKRRSSMDVHWTTIGGYISVGDTFQRSDVEQWANMSRSMAVQIINYGLDHGMAQETGSRGDYKFIMQPTWLQMMDERRATE